MKTTWQKFTLRVRLIAVLLAALYVAWFVHSNMGNTVKIDFVFKQSNEMSILTLILFTSIISIFGWWLLLTIFRTMRSMQEIQRRAQLEKIEKEHKDMLEKASRLHTREETSAPQLAQKMENVQAK